MRDTDYYPQAPLWSPAYSPYGYPLVTNCYYCQCDECRTKAQTYATDASRSATAQTNGTENSPDLLDGLVSAAMAVMRSFVLTLAWLIHLSEKLVQHTVNAAWGLFNASQPEPAQLEMAVFPVQAKS